MSYVDYFMRPRRKHTSRMCDILSNCNSILVTISDFKKFNKILYSIYVYDILHFLRHLTWYFHLDSVSVSQEGED